MSTLNLMVCPHDTAGNPERWFLVTQYMSLRLEDLSIHFDIAIDFADFHERFMEAEIVYANPNDGVKLVEKQGFQSFIRPHNIYDEVVFIANEEVENPSLEMLQGEEITTVTSMLPTNIGLRILDKHNIVPAGLNDKSSWLDVINSIRKNETRFGFLYKDTYDALSDFNKEALNAYFFSEEQIAFHSFYIAPDYAGEKEEIARVLLEMNSDPEGKQILEEMQLEKWVAVTPEEMESLHTIVTAST